jgi:plasmid stabilization system protein ParE
LKSYKLLAEPRVAGDLLKARLHYEQQHEALGDEFLGEISSTYDRIQENPLKYQVLRSDIRRALCRRFPFGVFFSVKAGQILVLAVLHTANNPEEWMSL